MDLGFSPLGHSLHRVREEYLRESRSDGRSTWYKACPGGSKEWGVSLWGFAVGGSIQTIIRLSRLC